MRLSIDWRATGDTQIVDNMLKDHTTGMPIYWATGERFFQPLTAADVVPRRAEKDAAMQRERTRDHAEVFTPAAVCRMQNDAVDQGAPADWQEYAQLLRLEITCGEAPYLAQPWDAVTGRPIHIEDRQGLLDRKLDRVTRNAADRDQWTQWALISLCATYGFDYQGDNVLLAREALWQTLIDHHRHRWGADPDHRLLRLASYVISWNIWQMDGLTCGLPGHTPMETPRMQDPFCLPHQRLCLVRDWLGKKQDLSIENVINRRATKIQFITLLR